MDGTRDDLGHRQPRPILSRGDGALMGNRHLCSPVDVPGHSKISDLGHSARTWAGQEAVSGSNVPGKKKRKDTMHFLILFLGRHTGNIHHRDFHLQSQVQVVPFSARSFLDYATLQSERNS